MVELLEFLSAAKSMNDQASLSQAVTEHAATLNQLVNASNQHAQQLQVLQRQNAMDFWLIQVLFGVLLVTIIGLSLVGILYIRGLERRVRSLESIPHDAALSAK